MKGLIVLEKEIFEGELFGFIHPEALKNVVFAEFVFNTSMTGYQEILTDPSYAGQAVCFTAAHVGNTGANHVDMESKSIYAEALIVANYAPKPPSNFRSEETLDSFLKRNQKLGIHDVDTRRLTLFLRDRGVTPGMIIPESLREQIPALQKQLSDIRYDQIDWIKKVTTKEVYELKSASVSTKSRYKVVAYDYGVKAQLLRDLNARGCDVTVVPADYAAEKVMALKPDGVFLSNGPGDPKLATYAVENTRALLGKVPVFGVCMGHQVLAMAVGAKTYKLKFGHRGGNQPVKNLIDSSIEISSHNHGYAVDVSTLPAHATLTHSNLNDGCCEGIRVENSRAFSVQYHPESSPGPHDSAYLFDQFISMMAKISN
jgi:carbamoyl-phosphate synthase small subunit